MDLGFFLTAQALRRQLCAMPCELYLIRLIHNHSRRPYPGERLWSAPQISHPTAIRFLRARNREGCDVYILPYAENANAGYILLDLDQAAAHTMDLMRSHGHEPCVLLETSPGHQQAWVRVSATPLPAAVATGVGKRLARLYGGDMASTDWRHLGRLAGFTNQKPARRLRNGYAPWVKVLHAHSGEVVQSLSLPQDLIYPPAPAPRVSTPPRSAPVASQASTGMEPAALPVAAAVAIYSRWLHRLRIPQRFPQPDSSIADFWIAKELLARRVPVPQVRAVIAGGSPGFPRRYPDPLDYLRYGTDGSMPVSVCTTSFSSLEQNSNSAILYLRSCDRVSGCSLL
jgi:hypothetical protein